MKNNHTFTYKTHNPPISELCNFFLKLCNDYYLEKSHGLSLDNIQDKLMRYHTGKEASCSYNQ